MNRSMRARFRKPRQLPEIQPIEVPKGNNITILAQTENSGIKLPHANFLNEPYK